MILVRLLGGLGNQMFQYACGRALSLRNGQELWLDPHQISKFPDRAYALGSFQIEERLAGRRELWQVETPFAKWGRQIRRLSGPSQGGPGWRIVEAHFNYQALSLQGQEHYYLIGYWQSEKYFRDAEKQLRHDFQFKHAANQANAEMLREIGDTLSVSLHVRRGDFVQDPKTTAYHGTCSLEYYQNAAERIASTTGKKPVFFAFSDDPDWVAANLKLPFPLVLVRHNPAERAVEDLRLMSACRHHITANSSFSWWGAWLGDAQGKVVICPKRWFQESSGNDDRDLIPDTWIRL